MDNKAVESEITGLKRDVKYIRKTLDELIIEVRGKFEDFSSKLEGLQGTYIELSSRSQNNKFRIEQLEKDLGEHIDKSSELIVSVQKNTEYRQELQSQMKFLKWIGTFIGFNNIIGIIGFTVIGYLYFTGQI